MWTSSARRQLFFVVTVTIFISENICHKHVNFVCLIDLMLLNIPVNTTMVMSGHCLNFMT